MIFVELSTQELDRLLNLNVIRSIEKLEMKFPSSVEFCPLVLSLKKVRLEVHVDTRAQYTAYADAEDPFGTVILEISEVCRRHTKSACRFLYRDFLIWYCSYVAARAPSPASERDLQNLGE